MRIDVGTSGWSYPTGKGTWNGPFYPRPRPRGFDELAYYAQHFRFVEINSTFYGQPRAEYTARWAERTPPDFIFAAKLYQQFTHPGMFLKRLTAQVRRQLNDPDVPAAALEAIASANAEDLDAFRRGLEPLANAGKLGPLLAQFPPAFHDTPEARAHLAALLRAFHGYDVAVELRHRSWSDHADDTRRLIKAFNAALVWIDEPKFADSIVQPEIPDGPFVYVRLHGRNATHWWNGDRDTRYDYDYSAAELRPIAARLVKAGRRAYAAANNHPNARSINTAKSVVEMIQSMRPELEPVRALPPIV